MNIWWEVFEKKKKRKNERRRKRHPTQNALRYLCMKQWSNVYRLQVQYKISSIKHIDQAAIQSNKKSILKCFYSLWQIFSLIFFILRYKINFLIIELNWLTFKVKVIEKKFIVQNSLSFVFLNPQSIKRKEKKTLFFVRKFWSMLGA